MKGSSIPSTTFLGFICQQDTLTISTTQINKSQHLVFCVEHLF